MTSSVWDHPEGQGEDTWTDLLLLHLHLAPPLWWSSGHVHLGGDPEPAGGIVYPSWSGNLLEILQETRLWGEEHLEPSAEQR